MIQDPVDVRISVLNKSQVWKGVGGGGLDPPPRSATAFFFFPFKVENFIPSITKA